jgi:hypothetical protein
MFSVSLWYWRFFFLLRLHFLERYCTGYINLVGEENVRWFVNTFWFLLDIPIIFLVLGIFCMLGSGLIAIGGLYSSLTFWICLGMGVTFTSFFLLSFMIIRTCSHHRIHEMVPRVRPQRNEDN